MTVTDTQWTDRGILNPRTAHATFDLSRHLPAPELRYFVDRYWIIHWDVDAPHTQETLPYPCVNAVIETQIVPGVYGVDPGKFTRRLEGSGKVFGIKFRPGGFRPFGGFSVGEIKGRAIGWDAAFNTDCAELVSAVLAASEKRTMIALMDDFLLSRLPEPDPMIGLINRVIERIIDDYQITKVDHLLAHFPLSKRSLQRIFRDYVGISPKWVIQRYRLHEAAQRLATDAQVDCASLAYSLGYTDQAHFIKDFRAIVGKTPAEYARSTR